MNQSAALLICLLAGCHEAGPPSSVPIPAIAFDALYVVNGDDGTISVLDAATSQVAATIALENADYPHHIYLSPDRSRLAVAVPGTDLSGGHAGGGGHGGHGGGGSALVLDAHTGETLVARRFDDANHNAIFSPDGAELWTAQSGAGTVLVLDAATLSTRASIPVGAAPAEVTLSLDGKLAFVANGGSDDVTVVDVRDRTVAKTIAVGDNPVGAWLGNDGVMYVDNEVGKTLSAIDVGALAVVRTYELGFTPAYAATAPGGELWVTDTDAGRLVFYQAGSTVKTGETATGAGAHAIVFSADGKTAYVSNQSAGTVSVLDVATRSVVKTVTVGAKPNGMVFRSR